MLLYHHGDIFSIPVLCVEYNTQCVQILLTAIIEKVQYLYLLFEWVGNYPATLLICNRHVGDVNLFSPPGWEACQCGLRQKKESAIQHLKLRL